MTQIRPSSLSLLGGSQAWSRADFDNVFLATPPLGVARLNGMASTLPPFQLRQFISRMAQSGNLLVKPAHLKTGIGKMIDDQR